MFSVALQCKFMQKAQIDYYDFLQNTLLYIVVIILLISMVILYVLIDIIYLFILKDCRLMTYEILMFTAVFYWHSSSYTTVNLLLKFT